jgi:hypothetical protein
MCTVAFAKTAFCTFKDKQLEQVDSFLLQGDVERTYELHSKIICGGCTMQSAINVHLECADVTFEVMSSKTCHDVTT